MRQLAAVACVVLFGALATLVAGQREQVASAPVAAPPRVTADPAVTYRFDPEVATGRLATADRAPHGSRVVSGLQVPIEGAAVPTDPESLPEAERAYRAGWHEGIDFPAESGTPVHAVAAGVIVRVDADFVDWDEDTLARALEATQGLGYTPEPTLDRIRGRQVWIDHGHGLVSRYAHLESVAPLTLGTEVERGQVIGTVGSSGFPEGGPHLHVEIRVGDSYLGDGLSGEALARVVARVFD